MILDGRIQDGPAVTVTTWGSSTCPFRIKEIRPIGDTLHILGHDARGRCTADFRRNVTTERLPKTTDFSGLVSAAVTTVKPYDSVYARFSIGIE